MTAHTEAGLAPTFLFIKAIDTNLFRSQLTLAPLSRLPTRPTSLTRGSLLRSARTALGDRPSVLWSLDMFENSLGEVVTEAVGDQRRARQSYLELVHRRVPDEVAHEQVPRFVVYLLRRPAATRAEAGKTATTQKPSSGRSRTRSGSTAVRSSSIGHDGRDVHPLVRELGGASTKRG